MDALPEVRSRPSGSVAAIGALCVATWLAAIWWAPHWRAAPPGGLRQTAAAVYALGARLCHQQPARSFWRGSQPLPVCARCLGLYLGAMAGLLAAGVSPRYARTSVSRIWLTVAAMPTLVTLGIEWIGVGDVTNPARFVAAMPAGAVAAWIIGTAASEAFALARVRQLRPGLTAKVN